jgi:choline dehydrogenase-like flavoprotein
VLVYTAPNNGGRQYADEIRDVAAAVLDAITGGKRPRWQSELVYFGAAQIGHAGGTLRMGGKRSGVVDDTQRLHEYDNLYVGDLSVFPSILAAKPSLTLAALSLRLADTLLDRLPEPAGDPKYRGVRRRRLSAGA